MIQTRRFVQTLLLSIALASFAQAPRARADDNTPVDTTEVHSSDAEKSLVLIMVDSIRPDIIDEEVAKGNLPNIKAHFYDQGTRFQNSYAPTSLDVPAWASILTGVDVDRSGIKGSETFDRDSKTLNNYLDWRVDLFSEAYRRHGRAYRQIRTVGNAMIFDWFSRGEKYLDGKWVADDDSDQSEIYFTFFPINDSFPNYFEWDAAGHLMYLDVWRSTSFRNAALKLLFDWNSAQAFDRYATDKVVQLMSDDSGPKKKLIGAYYAGPGYLAHVEYQRGRRALIEMDHQIGRIFETMRRTRYSNSVVVLVGDHGFIGGQENMGNNPYNPLRGETFALTATNLSYYLGGWYNKPGYSDYNFNVEAPYAAEGKFSLFNLTEIEANPYQCTNIARISYTGEESSCESYVRDHPDQITAAVTTSQTISLPYARRESGDWDTPNNWYTLTHYELGNRADGTPIVKNLITDLENFTIDNLAVFSSRLAAKIGNKPLDWLALTVSADELNRSPLIASPGLLTQDAVLIYKSAESQALILSRTGQDGMPEFRYYPIRHFNQTKDGIVSFDPSSDSDPLGYYRSQYANRSATGTEISDADWFNDYHNARDWVSRYSGTAFPNTVSALYQFTHYSGNMKNMQSKIRADLFLNPNYGHIFAVNNDVHEVNHGMWQKEAVQNVFMMSGPGIRKNNQVNTPAFATDVVPTALKAAGFESKVTIQSLSGVKVEGKVLQDAFE